MVTSAGIRSAFWAILAEQQSHEKWFVSASRGIRAYSPLTDRPVDEVHRMTSRFRQNRRRWQLTAFAVVALLMLTPLLPALLTQPARAQDSDESLAGKPLNFGDLVVINRPYASNGAQLALERFYVDRGIIADPYLSAVAG